MSWLEDFGKMADGKEYGSWSTWMARTMFGFVVLFGAMLLIVGGLLTYQLVVDAAKGEDVVREIVKE